MASDMLTKLRQERKPYEAVAGETEAVYERYLGELVRSVENGARDVIKVLKEAAVAFKSIELLDIPRKPVIAIVGEIFMRDNAFCSGFLRDQLEELGAETVMEEHGRQGSAGREVLSGSRRGPYRAGTGTNLRELPG